MRIREKGEVKTSGHWSVSEASDGRILILTEDFTYDAGLTLTGDFPSKEEKIEYAQLIADTLNK